MTDHDAAFLEAIIESPDAVHVRGCFEIDLILDK
jgi:hypothetical protein